MPAPVRYEFGPFTLEPASFRLTRDGADVPLTPKAFELLALLVRERHRVLTKQELLDAVWRDTAVVENTLTQRIKEIREALGDRVQEPIYIRTLSRIGFQFIGEVIETAARTPVGIEGTTSGDAARLQPPEPVALSPGEASVDRAQPVEGPTVGRRLKGFLLSAAAIAVAAMTAVLVYGTLRSAPAPDAAMSDRRVMLAILPFENLTGDPGQRYIADGLTEEMIAELGRLDPARIGVIARTSVMTYHSTTKSVAQIARELAVDFVLEGSVRREADRVRIVAQLIRASDQTHVWAERYDRDLHSLLSLQSEIARAIAQQTRTTLSVKAEEHIRSGSMVDPEPHQAYLKGRFFLNQRTPHAIRLALEQFQHAIAVEPSYAQAYAGLADAYELMASYANAEPHESMERSVAAARHAIELDPRSSEAYTSLGSIHANYTWNWSEAEKAYARALDLNPSNVLAHKGYGALLSYLGRHDEAIAEARRALKLDPLSLLMHANLGITYHRAHRQDEAVKQMEQTLSMDPNYMLGHLNLGLILAAKKSYDAAALEFSRALTFSPEFGDARGLVGYAYARAGRRAEALAIGTEDPGTPAERRMSRYVRAHYLLGLGNENQALDELERAYAERSWHVALLKVDPLFDDVRAHPRFVTLLRRMQFP